MNKKEIAIFDNTVFNIAARIPSCDLIASSNFVFSNILVPLQVFTELQNFPSGKEVRTEQIVARYLNQIETKEHGLQICTTFDPITLACLQGIKGVDKGEAEAVAQAEKRQVRWFFTDDEKCAKVLQDKYWHIKFVPTLFLITLLDVQGELDNYALTIREYLAYKPLPNRGGKVFFRYQYEQALRYFDLAKNSKLISQKTSFRQLKV